MASELVTGTFASVHKLRNPELMFEAEDGGEYARVSSTPTAAGCSASRDQASSSFVPAPPRKPEADESASGWSRSHAPKPHLQVLSLQ